MERSSTRRNLALFLGLAPVLLCAEQDVLKISAPKNPVTIRLDKPKRLQSLIFDPGALHAITIEDHFIELPNGGSVLFKKLPGDVGMGKTARQTIASDLRLSGAISLSNQTRHYLGGEKLLISGKLLGSGTTTIKGVKDAIVQLSGDNSDYTGSFVIETGGLMLGHSSALGSGKNPVSLKGGAIVIGARVSTTHDFDVLSDAIWDAHGPNGTHDGKITIHKGSTFTVKNGGGNTMTWQGEISGEGDLFFAAHGTTFGGEKANTVTGTFTVGGTPRGATIMARSPGTNVIAHSLIMAENGLLRWAAHDQIADKVSIIFRGEMPTLELAGYTETVGTLDLQGDARINHGNGGQLRFADSSTVPWNKDNVLMIFNSGEEEGSLYFGNNEQALSIAQLQQIGFVNPAGLPPGTYTAKLSANGKLVPTNLLVAPVNLPVDLTPEADAQRRKLYEVNGLSALTGANSPIKKQGAVISFFGDSITWGGGYLNLITRSLAEGQGTRNLGARAINHGVNGGGVLTLRDGDKGTAHFGNTKPQPFADSLAEDNADVAVIYIGVNDVWWRKTTPEIFEKALTDLVIQSKAAGARPVLATLAIMKEKVGEKNPKCDLFAALTRKVAKSTGATLVDLRAAFIACMESESIAARPGGAWTSNAKLLTHDGVHPNSRGNQILAELLAQGIAQALQK
jgi:lysophospholipase L1-like esterase